TLPPIVLALIGSCGRANLRLKVVGRIARANPNCERINIADESVPCGRTKACYDAQTTSAISPVDNCGVRVLLNVFRQRDERRAARTFVRRPPTTNQGVPRLPRIQRDAIRIAQTLIR